MNFILKNFFKKFRLAIFIGFIFTIFSVPTFAAGNAELISKGRIAGWACAPDDPDSAADVLMLRDDGVPIASVTADIYREDAVKIACGSNTNQHGFEYTWLNLMVGVVGYGDLSQWHWVHVYVRRADGGYDELSNSPQQMYFGLGFPEYGPP